MKLSALWHPTCISFKYFIAKAYPSLLAIGSGWGLFAFLARLNKVQEELLHYCRRQC